MEVGGGRGEGFEVLGLAAGSNVALLQEQAREFKPRLIWAEDADARPALESAAGRGARWTPLEEQAAHPDADLVVVGTVGKAGLGPTLAALRAGKAVALANKEVLVMAGAVVTRETIGSLASAGKSERMRVIASRTSSSAAERSVPKRNSMLVVEAPSSTVEVICSMPAIVATASSTLRVISLSICVGATPG